MSYFKIALCAAGLLTLAACNSSTSGSANNGGAVSGVATAAQISVVTAK